LIGQVYMITDENRLAVAHAVNAYTAVLKEGEAAQGGGTPNWGSIVGNLSNQTDLKDALDGKAPLANPEFTGNITATGTITGSNLSGTNTGDQTTITGNAGSATVLQTSRNFSISGGGITAATVGFNGSGNVVLSASVDAGHITPARMAPMSVSGRLLGSNSTSTPVTEISAGTGLSIASSSIRLSTANDMTIKGNVSGNGAVPVDLTGTQATTILDVFTSSLKGLAPASGGGTANFLRADGTWAAPTGRKFTATIGNGAATTITVTHNLNTYDVVVDVFLNSGNRDSVIADVTRPDLNTVALTFATAPTTNQYRVVVVG
jgi:hypothetical protein